MFLNNLSFETKLHLRSNWLLILFICISLPLFFATYNGSENIAKRNNDILKAKKELKEKDSIMLATLSKIEKGEKVDGPYWRLPSEPMTIGYRNPRLAIMTPNSMSFLATGQSDMYTHFKSPTVYGNNFALDYSEMVNPVQLLFGNFDLSFVIIFILPLLIIAYTFNILSKEKELGTLRLLAAQPISTIKWLLQKITIRFVIFTVLSLLALFTAIVLFSRETLNDFNKIASLSFLITSYNLFWFALSFIINIKVNNSSKNALTLISLWLFIVLILPATINQIGNSLYPTPSRLKMINEIRLIKKENEEKQNEIMDDYLRNHPELAQGSNKEKFNFWHNYFASEKMMEKKTKPLITKYETQLKKQQKLISLFEFLSPSILMKQSLNKIAGTSEMHYNDYKKQVFEYSDEWRNYLVPMLFKEQKFTLKNYNELPKFIYKNRIDNNVWLSAIILTLTSIIIFLFFSIKGFSNSNLTKLLE